MLFGVPARCVRSTDDQGATGITYAGYLDDEVFLLSFTAPTSEALDTHLATSEAMVASLRAIGE
jgi:hypothetical protein